LKFEVSEITPDKSGYQQTISFMKNGRQRKEIFVGRNENELAVAVKERCGELER